MTKPASFNSILLVEDDADIREMLQFNIARAGYEILEAESAEQALEILDTQVPALAIIDWMLPGMNGVDLARRLRADSHTQDLPLLMLTARSEEADKLKSFGSGVDDYLTKPFSPKELIARIKALLRRSGASTDPVLRIGSMALDLQAHQLRINEKVVHLGPTEFRLLELLMQNPGRAFERAALLDKVWGRGVYVEDRTVDVHVLRLRRALKPFGVDHLVETVRGVGYRFSA